MGRAASQLGAVKAVEKSRNGMARKRRALFSSFPGDESIFFPSSLVKNWTLDHLVTSTYAARKA